MHCKIFIFGLTVLHAVLASHISTEDVPDSNFEPETSPQISTDDTGTFRYEPIHIDFIAHEWLKNQLVGATNSTMADKENHFLDSRVSVKELLKNKKWKIKKYCIQKPEDTEVCMKAEMKTNRKKNQPINIWIQRQPSKKTIYHEEKDMSSNNLLQMGYLAHDSNKSTSKEEWIQRFKRDVNEDFADESMKDEMVMRALKGDYDDTEQELETEGYDRAKNSNLSDILTSNKADKDYDYNDDDSKGAKPGRLMTKQLRPPKKAQEEVTYRCGGPSDPPCTGMLPEQPKSPLPSSFLRAGRMSVPEWARCSPPSPLKTSEVLCKYTEAEVTCMLYCVYGHTYPEGITRATRCSFAQNVWTKPFAECQPFVDCTLRMRTAGTLDCITNELRQGTRCRIRCASDRGLPALPMHDYQCRADGRWKPRMAHCVQREGIVVVNPPPGPKVHHRISYPR